MTLLPDWLLLLQEVAIRLVKEEIVRSKKKPRVAFAEGLAKPWWRGREPATPGVETEREEVHMAGSVVGFRTYTVLGAHPSVRLICTCAARKTESRVAAYPLWRVATAVGTCRGL